MRIDRRICIIGAGPAGVTTSLFLAKQGVKSTLIDKAVFPRHKPCADNITGNTIRVLNELDPNFIESLQLEKKSLQMKGIVAHAANNHKMKIDFLPLETDTADPSCYAIPRIKLDNELMNKAKADPLIEVIEGFNVSNLIREKNGILIESKRQSIFTNLAIICSGSNANFIKNLHTVEKEDKHFAVGVRGYYKNVKPSEHGQYCELYITKDLLPGGLYVTQFTDETVNVNVVVRSDVVKKKKLNLKQILQDTLATHPLLKERFAEAELVGKLTGSGLFLGTKKRKISGDNFMLVGDAAGLIDLLSANGIPQAMLSGKIAAEFAAKCDKANDFSLTTIADYDERVFDRIKNYLKMSKFVAPFLSSNIALTILLKGMNFIAKKYDKNDELRDLIYDHDATKKLIKPKFYYRLFFGIKNSEALG
ncbi:MAG: NAD(P)/FAD-dependent oxidoreductase [Saprospiraceae bacterium]